MRVGSRGGGGLTGVHYFESITIMISIQYFAIIYRGLWCIWNITVDLDNIWRHSNILWPFSRRLTKIHLTASGLTVRPLVWPWQKVCVEAVCREMGANNINTIVWKVTHTQVISTGCLSWPGRRSVVYSYNIGVIPRSLAVADNLIAEDDLDLELVEMVI